MLPVVVSLDPPPGEGWDWALRVAEDVKDVVAAFKIGWPLLLEGKDRVMELKKLGKVIADLKLADISFTMLNVVKRVDADAFIAHAFVGRKRALRELREYLSKEGKELYLVVAMSHKGAEEVLNKLWAQNLLIAYEVADGVVAPATRPKLLRLVRKYWPRKILSPGIGVQGARPCSAINNGADLEIVGRTITRNPNPRGYMLRLYGACLKKLP